METKHLITLALLASLGRADLANAERWRTYSNVGLLTGAAIRIHWLDSSEGLREVAKGHEIKGVGLKGFSILKRHAETGEYVCDVYVVKMTGAPIDGERTKIFGHEILHCFGLRHE